MSEREGLREAEPRTDAGRWLLDHQGLINIGKIDGSMRGDEIDLRAAIVTIEGEAADLFAQETAPAPEPLRGQIAALRSLSASDDWNAGIHAALNVIDGMPWEVALEHAPTPEPGLDVAEASPEPTGLDATSLRKYIVANMHDGDDSGVMTAPTAAWVDETVAVVMEWLLRATETGS